MLNRLLASLVRLWHRCLLARLRCGADWIENRSVPQSLLFYAELLPLIYQCTIACGRRPVRICDIGAGTGAGANLVATVQSHLYGWPTKVTAFSIGGRLSAYAEAVFPNMTYRVGEPTAADGPFDLAIASHVVEHVPRPAEFVSGILDVVEFFAVVYVPFRERQLCPTHCNRFDEASIRSMPGVIWSITRRSAGWRTENDSSCAVFVCATSQAHRQLDLSSLKRALDAEMRVEPVQ